MKHAWALSLLLLTASVSACLPLPGMKPQVGPPWMQNLLQEAPNGPPNFQLGWRHGCETGIAATANHFQKFYYRFTQDWRLAQDHEYYTGWKIGWMVCQRYVFQYYKRTI